MNTHEEMMQNKQNSELSEVLLNLNLISKDQLENANIKINQSDTKDLGAILVENDYLSKRILVTTIAKHINLPKAKTMLKERILKREQREKNVISTGIESNATPFVMDDSKVKVDLFFNDGHVKIKGPDLDIEPFDNCKMDELQVAQMSVMLLNDKQWEETEACLIESIKDFPGSVILRYQLIWLYNATGFPKKAIEHVRLVEESEDIEMIVYELLAWTMLKNKKYLESIRLYQILCKSKVQQPIWFYLLAYCLFQEKLYKQSRKIFNFYLAYKDQPKEIVNNAEYYLDQIQGTL